MSLPAIDIKQDNWEIIRLILEKYIPTYEVWAFGSRATGNAKKYSDLDLAIINNEALSLNVRAELVDAFSESDLPWKVDVVDWATISEKFRKIIKKDRVVLQADSH